MIAQADVEEVLEELRPLVQADGADLALGSVDDDRNEVVLRLVVEDVSCLECILPHDLLQSMVADAVRRRLPAVTSVVLDDPRESEPSA